MLEFIIEHDSRGTVVDQEWNPDGPNVYQDWSTRFSWSGSRADAMVLRTEDGVRTTLARIKPSIRDRCTVRQFGTWQEMVLVEGGGMRVGV